MKPKTFQLIDLDRTLFDTSKFAKALTDEINQTQPGLGTVLDQEFEAAYKKEETFFMLRFLREQHGDAWFEELVKQVVEREGAESFLLPGTRERLAFAETVTDVSPAWGILTYGDEVDQVMKMKLVGLENAPVYFTDTPNKAEVIQGWQTEGGKFKLPSAFGGAVVDRLTLEDDKLRAFRHLPPGVLGVWVAPRSKEDPAVSAETGDNVFPAQNLFESIETLRSHL